MARLGYADPPYPGMARIYRDHADYAGEVDHAELISRLCAEYDGFVLHTATTTLAQLLPHIVGPYRLFSWVKTWATYKPNVSVAYAWEPIIVRPLRKRPRSRGTLRDWYAEPATTRRGLKGAKPHGLCLWLFDALGAEPDDTLDDLFPGTGAVTRAWESYLLQPQLHLYDAAKPTELFAGIPTDSLAP